MFDSPSKAEGKETEELNKSMDKLHIEGSSSGQAGTSSNNFRKKPVIIIVVGMAGNVVESQWICLKVHLLCIVYLWLDF